MSSLKDNLQDLAAPLKRNIKPAKKQMDTADQMLRAFVSDYPLAAAAGALALGLLLGRAMARR